MRPQTFVSQAIDSLVTPASYARVADQPLRRTIAYLAWLIAVAALAGAILTQLQLARWAKTEAPAWLHRLPEVTITDGSVSSPVQQPWTYATSDGRFVLILDTTGVTAAIDARYPQGVLLTERQLIFKRDPQRTQTSDLTRVRSFTFNAQVGRRWLRQALWFCMPVVWLATVLYLAATKPLQILCFSAWSLLLNALLARGRRYRTLWTMGAYALTGPMLLNLLMVVVTPTLPLAVGGLIAVGAYLAYLTLAVAQPSSALPLPPQGIKPA